MFSERPCTSGASALEETARSWTEPKLVHWDRQIDPKLIEHVPAQMTHRVMRTE
jgi:hypothetical protein